MDRLTSLKVILMRGSWPERMDPWRCQVMRLLLPVVVTLHSSLASLPARPVCTWAREEWGRPATFGDRILGLDTRKRLAGAELAGGKPSTKAWQTYWPIVMLEDVRLRIWEFPTDKSEPTLVHLYVGVGLPAAWGCPG